MSYTSAERTILHHCVDEDGFLVTLRATAQFDLRAYRELVQAISEYRDAIKRSTTMDRKIAGSLHGLLEQFAGIAHMLSREQHPRLDPKLIADSYAECGELVDEIFWG